MLRSRKDARNSHLPRDIIFPIDANIPTERHEYRALSPSMDRRTKELIKDLWHIHDITEILVPQTTKYYPSPYEPTVFRVRTERGIDFEYTYPPTTDLFPGPHLIRQILPNGQRGEWSEGPYLQERRERKEKERRDAGCGLPLKPLTEREHAAVMGMKELSWMEYGGRRKCHAAVLYLSLGKPEIGSEEQKAAFRKTFAEHEKSCDFADRRCV
ncbi:hypothetical protein BJ508DRAFT_331967 [Ascobolus immersus RN42]|uniref:Uncharacterized protein n=1 Tax=Ascobolus immersus RN42 TaxID=1160509 RepID=A0A3N4HSS6_ASCIM|nr:hypothetical protein BJ508DRAFT_331967 [Ascobolus immersus RN42]